MRRIYALVDHICLAFVGIVTFIAPQCIALQVYGTQDTFEIEFMKAEFMKIIE